MVLGPSGASGLRAAVDPDGGPAARAARDGSVDVDADRPVGVVERRVGTGRRCRRCWRRSPRCSRTPGRSPRRRRCCRPGPAAAADPMVKVLPRVAEPAAAADGLGDHAVGAVAGGGDAVALDDDLAADAIPRAGLVRAGRSRRRAARAVADSPAAADRLGDDAVGADAGGLDRRAGGQADRDFAARAVDQVACVADEGIVAPGRPGRRPCRPRRRPTGRRGRRRCRPASWRSGPCSRWSPPRRRSRCGRRRRR